MGSNRNPYVERKTHYDRIQQKLKESEKETIDVSEIVSYHSIYLGAGKNCIILTNIKAMKKHGIFKTNLIVS